MRTNKTKIFADISQDSAVVHFTTTHLREMIDVQKVVDEIQDLAINHRVKLVIVNFSRLKQMTSAFLSRLISLNKSLRGLNIELRVCGMIPDVERAFKICRLQKVIPLFKTEAKALSG